MPTIPDEPRDLRERVTDQVTNPEASTPEEEVVPDAPQVPKLSRKDHARQLRRAAYLKAKAQRAADPRTIAMKEAMKQRRRAAYQAVKERRKVAAVEEKRKRRERGGRAGR